MAHHPLLIDRPEIATDSLLLRRPVQTDMDAIVGIVGEWEVARRLARVPHPYGPADALFFLDQIVPAEWVWAITVHGADALIGVVGLTPGEGADTAELGYWLAPSHWNGGMMTEAASVVLSYGFGTLGLAGITSGYVEDNVASGRVLDKLGFGQTGRAMRPCLALGYDVPAVDMLLPRSTGSAPGVGALSARAARS